jgi:hypothetical protein
LYCNETDFGKFKICVEENTYKNKKVNEYVKFQDGLTRRELMRASIDKSEKSKQRILQGVESKFCKSYVTKNWVGVITSVVILLFTLGSLFLFVCILSFDFDGN